MSPEEEWTLRGTNYERIDADGKLLDPTQRWGGIMREVYSSDFEQANSELIIAETNLT